MSKQLVAGIIAGIIATVVGLILERVIKEEPLPVEGGSCLMGNSKNSKIGSWRIIRGTPVCWYEEP